MYVLCIFYTSKDKTASGDPAQCFSSDSNALQPEEDRKTVDRAVAGLPPREQTIIRLRFGIGGGKERTQKEVADMLGISQSYISRLEKKIIDRLREEIAGKV